MSHDRPREPIRILELRSARGEGGGPEKTILLGSARADPDRYRITVCYLRDLRDRAFRIDQRFRGRVRYVEVLERHSFDPDIWRQLRRLVREERANIVHSHDYKSNFLAYLLSWFEPVILCSTVHGWVSRSMRESVYYAADVRLLTRFPAVIAVSNGLRQDLIAAGARPDRVRFVPNAIDADEFRRQPARELEERARFGAVGRMVLGAVGRVEAEKGLDVLLAAVASLHERLPQLQLLVAGSGSLASDLEARAARLGVGRAVRFVGQVTDVIGFHHAIDVYVQASLREGTPNALLEAMALETPIVATAAGGTGDLIRDGEHALVVPPGDAEGLAGAIARAFEDRDAGRRRARRARDRVERELSFAARMSRVEAVYDELVAGRVP